MRHFQPEVVVHLAAQVAIAGSTADPAHDAEINIVGTINFVTGAALAAASRVIYISSGGAIYGQATTLPTPESTTPNPQSAYGLSKLAGELYVELIGLASSMDFTSLRLGNVYRPRQSPLTGGVVARFCDLLISGKPLQVVGDGRQSRDSTYVGDVVSAVTAAAWLQDPAGRAFNISSGRATSILDLAHV